MNNKNILISLIIGAAVSAGAFYLAFRNIPIAELTNYLTSINYLWIFPSVLIVLISFVFRIFRWQVILSSTNSIGFWRAFHPLMIGFMLNCVLPGRVGEVARPVILQQREQIPFSTGLATVAAERVFDLCILIMLFAIVLTTVQIDPDINIPFASYQLNKETLESIGSGMLKLSIALIAGITLISIEKFRKLMINWIMKIPGLFFFTSSAFKEKAEKKFCIPLTKMVDNFASGFLLVKYPKKIGLCIGISIIIWILQISSYYLFIYGCPGINLSFAEMAAVMVIICFFIALPSVPGFWGLWEAGGVFAMALFGISAKDAAGFTLANHAIQIFPVIIAGIVSALITGVNIWQVSYEEKVAAS